MPRRVNSGEGWLWLIAKAVEAQVCRTAWQLPTKRSVACSACRSLEPSPTALLAADVILALHVMTSNGPF